MTKAAPHEGISTPRSPNRAADHPLRFWRTLAEQGDEHALMERVEREFPHLLPLAAEMPNRRQFLSLMGASLALAGLSGCERRVSETIVPYVHQPEQLVPGRPLYYATSTLLDGYARGVLVESHMGRPTKIEGNPLHPASLGASDVFMQAETLTLYDPQRTQTVFYGGEINTWDALLATLRTVLQGEQARGGAGIRLLTEQITSPTLLRQIGDWLAQYPEARWHQWQPLAAPAAQQATRAAWGQDAEVLYRFENADVILSLDADFLGPGPAGVRYSRDFMAARRRERPSGGPPRMNRLYVVESSLSLAGGFADHRLPLAPADIQRFAFALARRLGVELPADETDEAGLPAAWIDAVANDLTGNRQPGSTLIVAGPHQPAAVHALVHAMNDRLGNLGRTVLAIPPQTFDAERRPDTIEQLAADMQDGSVELLVILGGNPVYTAPADLDFRAALDKVALRIHMGLYYDETSLACDWHVPASHALETWADARAFDGTVSILQPLIAPLYNSKSAYGLLAILTGHPEREAQEIIREYWQQQWGDQFQSRWNRAVHDGLVEGTAATPLDVSLQPTWTEALNVEQTSSAAGAEGYTLVLRPDPTVWDGCYAPNSWLQELPKPFTKLTWDNALLMGPRDAQQLGVASGDLVSLRHGEHDLDVAVWVTPGLPDRTLTLHLGGGRSAGGELAVGRGFNAYRLRTTTNLWTLPGVSVEPTGRKYQLVCTQEHHLLEGRELIRAGTLAEWQRDAEHPPFMGHAHEPGPHDSLFDTFEYEGYRWGMSIDVGACIACNACVIACQAENNIPVVGKQQVSNGREMHWIRIDTYYTGDDPVHPRSYHQPLPCMHCELAPCEIVCPVAATVHSSDGLNQMVYNRCVGTRYCSNNCPYKVRRFNYLQYTDTETPVLAMLRNPDVTVRSLGVMEKCTYCTQRISAARIEAEKQNRSIQDGEVVTACQQACPTSAIIFGDLNQPGRVQQLQQSPLDYGLLTELNTRPRTRYLAAIKNLNPALGDGLE